MNFNFNVANNNNNINVNNPFAQNVTPIPPIQQQQQQQGQVPMFAFGANCAPTQQAFAPKKTSAYRIGPKDYSTEKYANKDVAAMIITVSSGSSYDNLYTNLDQTPPDPEQYVSVFQLYFGDLPNLLTILKHVKLVDKSDNNNNNNNNDTTTGSLELTDNKHEIFQQIISEMKKLEGDNIVLNFECCGGCSENGFAENSQETVFALTKIALDKKFVCMFSDFSLKALIGKWNSDLLGPNPFRMVGSFSSNFTLEFDPKTLIDCPFAQLQNVGELCEKGLANSHAMGGTILYTVDKQFLSSQQNLPYKLTCLTVVTAADRTDRSKDSNAIPLGDRSGLAGHVMLEYPSGGTILTSCGHWVELVKLDVSLESVISHAEKKYGEVYAQNLSAQLNSYSGVAQDEQLRNISNAYVQSSAPCKYSKKY